jgi:N-acetylneuraminate synthase
MSHLLAPLQRKGTQPMHTFAINGRAIGPGRPTYIIAELSANHNQDINEALKLIRAAHEAGADAIKLQTYTPDTITIDSDKDYFQIKGTIWEGKSLYKLYGEAYTPWEWHAQLKRAAEDLGMDLFSTPFDPTAVDFLQELNVPAYKIASFEVVDLPLIKRIAATGKPIIMSTGMADLAEIAEAVQAIRGTGNNALALLKCTSAYPSPPEAMNLRTIPHMAEAFGVPVGLSDHTIGVAVPVAAVSLGACIIEKHFTLARAVPGPDSAFSLEPHEFRQMVDEVRVAEQALGTVSYTVSAIEQPSRIFRRSLFVVRDVAAGEAFTHENVRSIRPAHGLPPKFLPEVIGRRAVRAIERGTPLSWDLLGAGEER